MNEVFIHSSFILHSFFIHSRGLLRTAQPPLGLSYGRQEGKATPLPPAARPGAAISECWLQCLTHSVHATQKKSRPLPSARKKAKKGHDPAQPPPPAAPPSEISARRHSRHQVAAEGPGGGPAPKTPVKAATPASKTPATAVAGVNSKGAVSLLLSPILLPPPLR